MIEILPFSRLVLQDLIGRTMMVMMVIYLFIESIVKRLGWSYLEADSLIFTFFALTMMYWALIPFFKHIRWTGKSGLSRIIRLMFGPYGELEDVQTRLGEYDKDLPTKRFRWYTNFKKDDEYVDYDE